MQVHYSTGNLPVFKNAVITIGTFDGVHLGHQKIIDALLTEARSAEGESVVISFDPHPRKIVNPGEPLQLINTPAEKTELLSGTGIDHLVIVPFDREFAFQPADQYIADFLIRLFQPHTIIIGYDHHFGKGRQGNFALLASQADRYHYRLLEIPKYILDEIAVSSTKIRNAITGAEIEKANRLLGYDYFFEGTVIHGDKLGRTLGYPTANLKYNDPDKIHLGHGVYVVQVKLGERSLKGMLSVGTRPTLENSDERVEVNLFDFDEDIYGETLKVTVKRFLRNQERYNSLQELIKQLAIDKAESLNILS